MCLIFVHYTGTDGDGLAAKKKPRWSGASCQKDSIQVPAGWPKGRPRSRPGCNGQEDPADHPTDKPDSTSPSVAFWPLRATRCAECPQKEARLGGWVAERSKAPVLKTGGHRPYLSPLDGYSVVLSGFTGCSLPSCPACSCPVPVCWAANPVAKGGSSPSSS